MWSFCLAPHGYYSSSILTAGVLLHSRPSDHTNQTVWFFCSHQIFRRRQYTVLWCVGYLSHFTVCCVISRKLLCVCIHIVFETEMFDARDGSCVRVFRDPSVEKIWSGLLAKSSHPMRKASELYSEAFKCSPDWTRNRRSPIGSAPALSQGEVGYWFQSTYRERTSGVT